MLRQLQPTKHYSALGREKSWTVWSGIYLFSCDSSSRSPPVPSCVRLCIVCTQLVFLSPAPCCRPKVVTCNIATLQHYNIATLQLCDFATLQLCDIATLQLCNVATLQHCNIATLQHCNIAT